MPDTHRIDRRAARTRASLRSSLAHLLAGRVYDEITVTEICEVADIGRSTFYGHFTGKDDLKRDALKLLRAEILSAQQAAWAAAPRAGEGRFRFGEALFRHAQAHIGHHAALGAGAGREVALGAIGTTLREACRNELAACGYAPRDREAMTHIAAGIYLSALMWWLDGGAPQSPDQMDGLCRRLLAGALLPAS